MALLEASLDNRASWIELPTPAPENYSPTYTHEEKSYLDGSGYLVRKVVRYNRGKVSCGWNALTGEQNALLASLYDYDYFYLRYTDQKNNRVEMKCYAGPITGKTKFVDKKTYEITLRTNVNMNFIEY